MIDVYDAFLIFLVCDEEIQHDVFSPACECDALSREWQ
jgi:hypothetical protein